MFQHGQDKVDREKSMSGESGETMLWERDPGLGLLASGTGREDGFHHLSVVSHLVYGGQKTDTAL